LTQEQDCAQQRRRGRHIRRGAVAPRAVHAPAARDFGLQSVGRCLNRPRRVAIVVQHVWVNVRASGPGQRLRIGVYQVRDRSRLLTLTSPPPG
jgi:hypothetical protein